MNPAFLKYPVNCFPTLVAKVGVDLERREIQWARFEERSITRTHARV